MDAADTKAMTREADYSDAEEIDTSDVATADAGPAELGSEATGDADAVPETAENPAGEAAPGRKRRILIVDDEPDFTFMMGLTLEQTGQFEVRQENDAFQALATAREFLPDLILLDVMMPDMDGGDVLS